MRDGKITVFDFDNCMYCWYMFDLANLWTHGEGWCRGIADGQERMEYMKEYFSTILEGYRTETQVPDNLLKQLPLFIDMVLIENIVDEFECCARVGKCPEYEDISSAAECLIRDIPYAGIDISPVLIGGKDTATLIDGRSLISANELDGLGVLKLQNCDVLESSYIRLHYEVVHT